MAVKISKPMSMDATKDLLHQLGETRDVLDEISDEVNNPAVGKHCSVFYSPDTDTYRVVYLSQHLKRK